ncbi:hypothetical protein KVV02_000339 [Mortierella alpina]|uniref:Sds3-like-domain-containing protein n=1 Tax=Mortierella alpina TaxID=64518 RepID=A0A9P8A5F5_MORAP|nr:hypothetical protein KVV02_000339 [Mortierella alpina]
MMTEATSLRTRKQNTLPVHLRNSDNNNNSNNSNSTTNTLTKDKTLPMAPQNSVLSAPTAISTSPAESAKKLVSSGGEDEQRRRQGGDRYEKVSAEDLNGALLDGALDDVDDEDLDGDTEDGILAQENEGTPADQNQEGEEGEEGELDEDGDEPMERASSQDPAAEEDSQMESPMEDQGEGSANGDIEGRVVPNEDDEDDEDNATPAGHSEDESELPEDEGSHEEEGDEEDEDGEEVEDEEDEDDDGRSMTLEVKKTAPSSFPQKPTLNRPQLIAEEEKDSGDDLSDLSEFDDTDDSDDDDDHDGRDTTTATTTRSSRAKAEVASTAGAGVASRPSLGGRKRSLRENSRETKGREDKLKKEAEEEHDDDYDDPRTRHSDKETESEVAEDEDREEDEEAKVDDEDEEAEEEEDLEKKRVHMDAMEALTTIEVDFANLRDKMYEERMLELDREVEMINAGTHPELSTLMREIEDKREQRLRVAKAWRTHMGEIAQCEFEIKEYQAHCTYQSKKRVHRTDLVQDLGRKRRKLILELNLSSDNRRKDGVVPDKVALIRARKQRRAAANELRAVKEHHGFPTSKKLPTATNAELAEDFEAMGLPRPTSQPNTTQHGFRNNLGYEQNNMYMPQAASSPRPRGRYNWPGPMEYSPVSGLRTEVEIYVEGSRSNIDGIWYRPNDPVAVLDAAIGQYNAKYLHVTNDEVGIQQQWPCSRRCRSVDHIMLQKMDGSKTRLHLNLFRARKLYMQPRP